ncbi:MAG: hypothetical protein GX753_00220 [Erysipelothrix sp.]|nr:hypothetical protein [Erysipelothrix sp.]
MRNKHIQDITQAGLLSALGILIPIMMPLKLILPTSTYTLASHVPIFIAMFINTRVAIMVALGTTLGFFISMPLIVAARAFSHLVFVVIGSRFLNKHTLESKLSMVCFNLCIAFIHGFSEFLIVLLLTAKSVTPVMLSQYFIFLGLGTMVHSLVDFSIAYPIVKALNFDKR